MSEPVEIPNWILLIYQNLSRFNQGSVEQMIADFVRGCGAVGKTFKTSSTGHNYTKTLIGIKIKPKPALVKQENAHGNIAHVSRLAAYFVHD